MDDIELLRKFASERSEEAFRMVVERHVDFVYGVALRQLGDVHAAEEVAQAVFVDLARKASTLPLKTVLSGWLFRAARFAAANLVRSEFRRKRREWEAAQLEPVMHENPTQSSWEQMEPVLNEALEELSEKDRSALLLRFFEKKSLREVGERLGLNEVAAKKRVSRAVEKLRLIFQKRGLAISSAVLVATLLAQPAQAAPIGLAASIAAAAALKGTALTASTVTLGKGVLNIMAISKIKIAVAATAALLLVGGTTSYVVVRQSRARVAAAESADAAQALEIIETSNSRALDGAPPMVFVRVHEGSDRNAGSIGSNGKMMGKAVGIRELLATAYGTTQSRLRMAGGSSLPDLKVDYLVSLPSEQKEALQQAIREKLGWTAQRETRLEDIYVLSAHAGEFPGLRPARRRGGSSASTSDGQLTFNNATVDSFARGLEQVIHRPVINETGLPDRYDIFLTYDHADEKQPGAEAVKTALTDQLGLDLNPDKRNLEILLVQNVKSH